MALTTSTVDMEIVWTADITAYTAVVTTAYMAVATTAYMAMATIPMEMATTTTATTPWMAVALDGLATTPYHIQIGVALGIDHTPKAKDTTIHTTTATNTTTRIMDTMA